MPFIPPGSLAVQKSSEGDKRSDVCVRWPQAIDGKDARWIYTHAIGEAYPLWSWPHSSIPDRPIDVIACGLTAEQCSALGGFEVEDAVAIAPLLVDASRTIVDWRDVPIGSVAVVLMQEGAGRVVGAVVVRRLDGYGQFVTTSAVGDCSAGWWSWCHRQRHSGPSRVLVANLTNTECEAIASCVTVHEALAKVDALLASGRAPISTATFAVTDALEIGDGYALQVDCMSNGYTACMNNRAVWIPAREPNDFRAQTVLAVWPHGTPEVDDRIVVARALAAMRGKVRGSQRLRVVVA